MSEIEGMVIPDIGQNPIADFNLDYFNTLVFTKGLEVIHERALICPCKQKGNGHLSDCKNCLGTGWIFIEPKRSRMIIHSINMDTKYKGWSEEKIGTISVTSRSDEQFAFMDRITIEESEVILSQMMYPFELSGEVLGKTIYGVEEILNFYKFENSGVALKPIVDHYSFYNDEKNVIKFDSGVVADDCLSITYKHKIQYHIIDLVHEMRKSLIYTGGKFEEIFLPVNAIARRSHYILDSDNVYGTLLIHN